MRPFDFLHSRKSNHAYFRGGAPHKARSKFRSSRKLVLELLEQRTLLSGVTTTSFVPGGNYPYVPGPAPLYPVMVSANFDGKNGPDLAFVDGGVDNSLTLILNNGDGTFASPVTLNVGSPQCAPDGLAVADFDGNGKPDLAISSYYDNSVDLLLNYDPNLRAFQAVYTFSAPQAEGLAVGDFNHNGNLDLAVTDYSNNTITLLLDFDPTTHTFLSTATYSTDGFPISIGAGDFNGDGKTDLAVACAGSVDFFLGNGDGTFQTSVAFANPYDSTLTVEDFNGDGKADLAITNFLGGGAYVLPTNPGPNPDSMTILLGNSDLNQMFQSAVNYSIGVNALSTAVGDFNGDGIADLAVTSAGSTSATNQFGLTILYGQGNGSFGSTQFYGPSMFTFYGVAGDFNRDGLTDLAVFAGNDVLSAYNSANVSIFLNKPPYNFSGFLAPLSQNVTFGLNRTIPIKFQLTDIKGTRIDSLAAVNSLQIQALDGHGNPVGAPFNAASSDRLGLRNDGSQYIFDWQTKGLAAGSYEVLLNLADGTIKTKLIQISVNGSGGALMMGGTNVATISVGALLGGDIDLYVDNTNGQLTLGELARIQDAVTAVDAVTEPHGVAVIEVTDPSLADVTLSMGTTSAVGGYADGALGCTTDAGQITIIAGWNFYAGSDATQVGSGQYDFETVVVHELGHALGLGHSTNNGSVMSPTLNAGTANRALTVADMNVPDSDTGGACGLHASPVSGRAVDFSFGADTRFVASSESIQPAQNPGSAYGRQAWSNEFSTYWSTVADFSNESLRLINDSQDHLRTLANATIDDRDEFWSSIAAATVLEQITT